MVMHSEDRNNNDKAEQYVIINRQLVQALILLSQRTGWVEILCQASGVSFYFVYATLIGCVWEKAVMSCCYGKS